MIPMTRSWIAAASSKRPILRYTVATPPPSVVARSGWSGPKGLLQTFCCALVVGLGLLEVRGRGMDGPVGPIQTRPQPWTGLHLIEQHLCVLAPLQAGLRLAQAHPHRGRQLGRGGSGDIVGAGSPRGEEGVLEPGPSRFVVPGRMLETSDAELGACDQGGPFERLGRSQGLLRLLAGPVVLGDPLERGRGRQLLACLGDLVPLLARGPGAELEGSTIRTRVGRWQARDVGHGVLDRLCVARGELVEQAVDLAVAQLEATGHA